jgi:hypothetical protein
VARRAESLYHNIAKDVLYEEVILAGLVPSASLGSEIGRSVGVTPPRLVITAKLRVTPGLSTGSAVLS